MFVKQGTFTAMIVTLYGGVPPVTLRFHGSHVSRVVSTSAVICGTSAGCEVGRHEMLFPAAKGPIENQIWIKSKNMRT